MEPISVLYDAVKNCNWTIVNKYIQNGGDVNASLVLFGPKSGYTALHLAATENYERVKKLIEYGANVNSVDKDGAQPIHLACLLGNYSAAEALLEAGANPDAELTRDLVEKYTKNKKWSDDFGDKLTLLGFAAINKDCGLTEILLRNKANVGIKSMENKTLLMYAIENTPSVVNLLLAHSNNYSGLKNFRDNYPWHTLRYMQPVKRSPLFFKLLPLYLECYVLDDQMLRLSTKKIKDFIEVVFENYAFRREFKMFIPKEEKKFMDQLIADNIYIKGIIKVYEKYFINGTLKNTIVEHQSWGIITLYEAVRSIYDYNSLQSVIRSECLLSAYKSYYCNRFEFADDRVKSLFEVLIVKIKKAYDRRKILEKVEKIQDLRKAVPLPYELVLMIIDLLDCKSLSSFVNAFYQSPVFFQEFCY